MKENKAMCDDLEQAKLNRQRVKEGYGNAYYNQQRRAIEQTPADEPLPSTVATGELPYITNNHRQLRWT